jgi:hypothetical protein
MTTTTPKAGFLTGKELFDEKKRLTDGLRKHFGIVSPEGFLCPLHVQMRMVKIDLLKFDEWLHIKFPDYEDKNPPRSMKDVLEQEYSEEASAFIQSFF